MLTDEQRAEGWIEARNFAASLIQAANLIDGGANG